MRTMKSSNVIVPYVRMNEGLFFILKSLIIFQIQRKKGKKEIFFYDFRQSNESPLENDYTKRRAIYIQRETFVCRQIKEFRKYMYKKISLLYVTMYVEWSLNGRHLKSLIKKNKKKKEINKYAFRIMNITIFTEIIDNWLISPAFTSTSS